MRDDLGIAVIVGICDIDAHGELAGVHHLVVQVVFEGAVALVDIEVVVFVEVIADVEIGVAVEVDIRDGDAESVADNGAIDTGFLVTSVKWPLPSLR